MKKILSIIGARPQFIKHAPMQLELQKYFDAKTLHTGQHYDENMSKVFFDELNIPRPEYQVDLGGGKPQSEQTAIMLTAIEKVLMDEKFDAIIVYGDTNSTLAGTLAAVKMHIPIIHIEAGLRSYNLEMPEEVNRIVADRFAQVLFCPTEDAVSNLEKESITENIFLTGDVMCDMIYLVKDKVKPLEDEPYYFATLHRPYNTDEKQRLKSILDALQQLDKKVVLAIHPRTRDRMQSFGLQESDFPNIKIIPPVGYIESVSYQTYADAIITDSGGIQKEAYILGKKCITIRSETEWTETLKNGWNHLVFDDLSLLSEKILEKPGTYVENLYGDGNAAAEITAIIRKEIGDQAEE